MRRKITTLVADHDHIAREELRLLLRKDPAIALIGVCSNGTETIEVLLKGGVELLLLDVHILGIDGLQVVKSLPPEKFPVTVLLTAHDIRALRVFHAHAVEFLVKPINEAKFRDVVTHVKEVVAQRAPGRSRERLFTILEACSWNRPPGSPPAAGTAQCRSSTWLQRVPVCVLGKIRFVEAEHICWIEAADNYVRLHTDGGIRIVRDTITHFESRLDPSRFRRVHRSAIVNISFVTELSPASFGEQMIMLRDGTRIRVSRNRLENIRRLMSPP